MEVVWIHRISWPCLLPLIWDIDYNGYTQQQQQQTQPSIENNEANSFEDDYAVQIK